MKVKFLLTALIIANAILIAQTATQPALGNGSTADPYQIATLDNLFWITAENSVVPSPDQETRWLSHYVQTADIEASSTNDWFDGQGWSPIGFYYGWQNPDNRPFSGSYNGQNHSINALYMNRQIWGVGFIGFANNASIIQLALRNVNISGNLDVGPLVGFGLNSTVSDCHSAGNVSGNQYVGGLVGYQSDSAISNSYSAVSVYGSNYIGGLVGYQKSMTIKNCFSTGSVDGNYFVGGLVGYQQDACIDKCYSRVTVHGNQYVGGLVGYQNKSMINNSYRTGFVSGNNIIGGLVGNQYLSSINSSYSASPVNAIHTAGGLVGSRYDSLSSSCYWDTEISGQTSSFGGEGRSTEQMTYPIDADTYVGWDFSTIWALDRDHSINDGYPYLRQMPVSIEDNTVSGSLVSQVPTLGNHPNPFNPQTTIRFSVPSDGKVLVTVYNIKGQKIKQLLNETMLTGKHAVIWNGTDSNGKSVGSGLYFAKIKQGNTHRVHKMMLMK